MHWIWFMPKKGRYKSGFEPTEVTLFTGRWELDRHTLPAKTSLHRDSYPGGELGERILPALRQLAGHTALKLLRQLRVLGLIHYKRGR